MRHLYYRFLPTLIALTFAIPLSQAQTTRRYLIKPYNLGATTDVHARSVRSIQVRVTDENDHPLPDVPVLFSLLGAGGAAGGAETLAGSAGTLAGGLTAHVVTNAEGLATVEFQAGPLTGASSVLQAQVEGTDAVWQTTLKVIEPEPAPTKQNEQANAKESDNGRGGESRDGSGIGKESGQETDEEKKSSRKAPIIPFVPGGGENKDAGGGHGGGNGSGNVGSEIAKNAREEEREKKLRPIVIAPFARGSEKFIGHPPKDDLAHRQFTTTAGDRTSLYALRGQVVVVHFFGSWCGYSKAQARILHQLTEHGLPAGLQILGMSVKDPRSNPQLVRQFITDQQVLYPVVDPVDDKTFVQFVNSRDISVPQTLIYSSDGKLVAHYNGYSKEINESILAIVKDLLNGH